MRKTMRRKVYFHIGYPKTATSALQKYIFPNIEDLSYLGKFEGAAVKYETSELENILLSASTMLPEEFSGIPIASDLLSNFDFPVLISEETLLFNIFRPTLWRSNSLSVKDVANNLARMERELNVDFHIVLTIRNQMEMVSSIYAQCFNSCYSRIPETITFNGFLDYLLVSPNMLNALDYSSVYSIFSNVFRNVDLLVYENLKEDPDKFLQSLSEILSRDVSDLNVRFDNVRQGHGYKKIDDYTLSDLLGALRYKVKFLRHVRFPLLRRALNKVRLKGMNDVAIDVKFKKSQMDKFSEEYAESNSKISSRLCLNLENLGYPVK
jgi:hypothetical protein